MTDDDLFLSSLSWSNVSRRKFIKVLALASAGFATRCSGCGDSGESPRDGGPLDTRPDAFGDLGGMTDADAGAPDAGGGASQIFDVWRELREALRTSPDHLVARADDVVSRADPVEIFEFVRDEIRSVPASLETIPSRSEVGLRWGVRGTLRGGSGTFREKAELLADLYRRAGLDAEVVTGESALSDEDLISSFTRAVDRRFEPAIDDARLAAWRELLELGDEPAPIEFTDREGAESRAVGAGLAADRPELWTLDVNRTPTLFGRVPLVRVVVDGEERLANPIAVDTEFGDGAVTGAVEPAPAVDGPLDVTVKIEMALRDAPSARFPVVERTWGADEVVGRRVLANVAPVGGLRSLGATRIEDARAFFGALAVDGPGLEEAETERLLEVGEIVTLEGSRIDIDLDGDSVEVDGRAIDVDAEPGMQALLVNELDVVVRAVRFPRIELRVRALDVDGEPVSGLDASSFGLREEEIERGFAITANQPRPPRVLFVFDTSASMPAEFSGTEAGNVAREIASRVALAAPAAEFRAATLYGNSVQTGGDWTSSPDELATEVESLSGLDSQMWAALSEAGGLGPTVVVFVTDGVPTDAETSEARTSIPAGPPIIGVLVVDSMEGRSTLDRMAELSNGATVSVADGAEAAEEVSSRLGLELRRYYDISYTAPEAGPSSRTVKLDAPMASGQATYEIPVEGERLAPNEPVGLYLTVEVGGRSWTKTLGGRPHQTNADVPVTDDDLTSFRDALFGGVAISFEGGAPTLSAWLEDLLASKLAVEPLWQALATDDLDAVLEAASGGVSLMSGDFIAMNPPLSEPADGTHATFEVGLRVTVFDATPRFERDLIERRSDILPLTRFASIGGDQSANSDRTMGQTPRLALVEAARFEVSAAGLLADASLVPLGPNQSIEEVVGGLDPSTVARWQDVMEMGWGGHAKFVPVAGTPVAFWALDQGTGSLFAVGPDGNGMGVDEIRATLSTLETLLGILGIVATISNFGQVGFLVAYNKFLVRLYLRAAIVIATLEASVLDDEQLRELVFSLACSMMRETFPRGTTLWAGNLFLSVLELMSGTDACGGQL